MFVVTNIEPQKKRSGYYNIYLDGTYRFSLSELDLASYGLKTNQSIDKQELDTLLQTSLNSKAYNYSSRYLALRPRSCKEISDYLARKGFEPEQIEAAVDNLLQQKYLDDTEFARLWVRNRMLLNGRSLKTLRLELYKKGIDKDTIREVLSEVSQDDQLGMLQDLINKKRRLRNYQDDEKLVQYLIRNGFSYSLVKSALENLATTENESNNNS